MTKTIAITGGKGGTGKTLIATNLAINLANNGYKTLFIDCDVENPNSNILLGKSLTTPDVEKESIAIYKPSFLQESCTKCGICRSACYRHAILQFPDHFPSVLEHMCSGCKTCQKVCPNGAIITDSRIIGSQYFLKQAYSNLDLLVGELNPSEAISVKIVEALFHYSEKLSEKANYDFIIIDTAPGAHCDVEKSISDADLVIAVTEPTPFGEHDLNRILDLLDVVGQKADIILNRSNLTHYQEPLRSLAKTRNCNIIGEIPVDSVVIEDYAKGLPFVLDTRNFPAKSAFNLIYSKILEGITMEL
ncbi:Iron-sulfur cluster carrier protein [Candidatus Lokiarchaeum ossiferum]|uniref:Iron-sulfur cluster carrier protein n=1 Tax=Candidatus Lokiarchaeum ossiferum TaxID=2951803 RepID=A0ABY6HQ12_9ARCH|nr:Iron-sulfur cluster carrier protein [Candidatus Lokiarchaeum sp. B-35]